ncbi:3-hydroxyacyl-ACP dehydratase FabZ [Clostridia bacterium]|nr:3-hydroxyacyl-ACP dehydratase FabZ [Clostridia bacterium]
MGSIMDIVEIMTILPHRPPFLLIDRIEEMEEGRSATAIKNVTMNEYFFTGHFPGNPVMPGVLIIEALAQTGAVAILSLKENKGKTAYFGGIKKARFRRKVVPGDTLKLVVEITRMKGPVGIGSAVAYVNEEIAAEAELTFAVE